LPSSGSRCYQIYVSGYRSGHSTIQEVPKPGLRLGRFAFITSATGSLAHKQQHGGGIPPPAEVPGQGFPGAAWRLASWFPSQSRSPPEVHSPGSPAGRSGCKAAGWCPGCPRSAVASRAPVAGTPPAPLGTGVRRYRIGRKRDESPRGPFPPPDMRVPMRAAYTRRPDTGPDSAR
jgi:hypothetical protein